MSFSVLGIIDMKLREKVENMAKFYLEYFDTTKEYGKFPVKRYSAYLEGYHLAVCWRKLLILC